jgi:PEP-CTERM motif
VKRVFVLFAVLSVSAFAATIGTCTETTLSSLIGNPCELGDKMFDNFAYSGNVAASNVTVDFEMVGTEFHLILAPITGAGFFTNLTLTDRISVIPGVAPNIPPANYQIVGVKDQSNFSAVPGSSGLLNIVNTPGPTYNLVPGSEDGGPTFFAGTTTVTTISTLTGPGGTDGANPGLASVELDYIQANTAIPEPTSFALIGGGLVCLGLLRKRPVYS